MQFRHFESDQTYMYKVDGCPIDYERSSISEPYLRIELDAPISAMRYSAVRPRILIIDTHSILLYLKMNNSFLKVAVSTNCESSGGSSKS